MNYQHSTTQKFAPLSARLPKVNSSNQRVWEVDFLRGICILLMILDHFLFNFAFLHVSAVNYYAIDNVFFSFMSRLGQYYWYWSVRVVIRNIVVGLFLFLSGISCAFSKNNVKRLLKIITAASAVSLVTYFLDFFIGRGNRVELFIIFGILHLMAVSLAIFILINLATKMFHVKHFAEKKFAVGTGSGDRHCRSACPHCKFFKQIT